MLLVLASLGYLIYPMVLALIHAIFKKTFEKSDFSPTVSIILSAYNEEANIGSKIENFDKLEYPEEKLELIIVSDGSEDATARIVCEKSHPRVRLLEQFPRRGKTCAINLAVGQCSGEILVFTDCNTMFEPETIRRLVSPLAEPEIGLVSGIQEYSAHNGKKCSVNLYSRIEGMLKCWEGDLGLLVGADGAVYAMRKHLFSNLKAEYINDFFHPISVVKQGFRAVYEPTAKAMEEDTGDFRREMKRQERMTNQAVYILRRELGALVSGGQWKYALALIGHKVARWTTLLWLAFLFLTNLFLIRESGVYTIMLFAQAVFYTSAFCGFFLGEKEVSLPGFSHIYEFLGANYAMFRGLINCFRGQVNITWDIQRGNSGG
jgi:cellulose synthase/poly-beta-1,6-N-acetylglucosamine synthase-like glycosyltransferase